MDIERKLRRLYKLVHELRTEMLNNFSPGKALSHDDESYCVKCTYNAGGELVNHGGTCNNAAKGPLCDSILVSSIKLSEDNFVNQALSHKELWKNQ